MSTVVTALSLTGTVVAIAGFAVTVTRAVMSWRPAFSWHVDALYVLAPACWLVRDIRTGDWGGAAWWALLAFVGAWNWRDDYRKARRKPSVRGGAS